MTHAWASAREERHDEVEYAAAMNPLIRLPLEESAGQEPGWQA